METLAATTYDRFCRRMVARVRGIWGESFNEQSDDDLRQRVDRWITRARDYGLDSERAVVRYIDSTCAMGDDFEDRKVCSWAREILTDAGMSPELKAVRLWARVKQKVL